MDLEICLSARDHPQERLYTQSTAEIFSEAGQLGRLIPNNKRVGSLRKRSQPGARQQTTNTGVMMDVMVVMISIA